MLRLSLAAAWAAAGLPPAQPSQLSPRSFEAVEREWSVRRWALAPEEHAAELARAAAAEDWELRQAALDALWRAGERAAGPARSALVRSALSDRHPNVRATALAAAGRGAAELAAHELALLAEDPWPGVRQELIRHLARRPGAPGRDSWLASLAADSDPALARAARDALWVGAFDGLAPPSDLAAWVGEPADFVHGLSILARGTPGEAWLDALRSSALAFESPAREARLGLIDALEVARGGGSDGHDLARAWLLPVGGDEAVEREARALRLAAAGALGRRAETSQPRLRAARERAPRPPTDLAVELARRAALADARADPRADLVPGGAAPAPSAGAPPGGGAGDGADDGAGDPDGERAKLLAELDLVQRAGIDAGLAVERWIEGALLAAGPQPSRVARELHGASAELCAAWWSGVGLSARSWEALELERWLAPGPLELRARVLEAVARTFARSADPASARALVGALEDPEPELRAIAFVALARAAEPLPHAEALAASWRSEDPDTRLERLRWLPRGVALPAFREELVELWESGRGRELAVLELLRPFAPDEALAGRVGAWLEAELALVAGEHAAARASSELDFAPRGARPPETLAESRAKALALAHAHLADPDASGAEVAGRLEAWLERAEPISIEVAKTLAFALGQRPQGRALLAGWLEPPRRTRLRVEAGLALLGEDAASQAVRRAEPAGEHAGSWVRPALAVLLERMPHCDQPLRARILNALSGYGHLGEVRARLRETALAGRDGAERLLALSSLSGPARGARGQGSFPDPLRAEIERNLADVLARSGDLDVRRAAIELLGESGGALARAALDELAARPASSEELEHLADVLLPARARLADPPPIEAQVLAAPAAAAREELEARFAGRRLAPREFVYRGQLAAALHLAQAGRLEAVLASHRWWELDARLLLLLGERLWASSRAPVRERALELVRAGLSGLEGEAWAPDREQLSVWGRALLARAAFAGEDPAQAAPHLEELLLAWRLGELGPRQLLGPLGPIQPDLGRDPLAWLEAGLLQARAHAALAAGELEAARALARDAARAVGSSDRARAQQQRLEALLDP